MLNVGISNCIGKLVSEASLMESSSSGSDTDSTELHQFRGMNHNKLSDKHVKTLLGSSYLRRLFTFIGIASLNNLSFIDNHDSVLVENPFSPIAHVYFITQCPQEFNHITCTIVSTISGFIVKSRN